MVYPFILLLDEVFVDILLVILFNLVLFFFKRKSICSLLYAFYVFLPPRILIGLNSFSILMSSILEGYIFK